MMQEVIVFAVNGGAAAAAIESIGADKIGEKIVIDAMNPITYDPATYVSAYDSYCSSLHLLEGSI
jgi:predicted dinucleotide-binding enzyme